MTQFVYSGPTPQTMSQLIDWVWFTHLNRCRSKKSTISILQDIRETLGPKALGALKFADLQAFVDSLRLRGNSESTLCRKVGVLGTVIRRGAMAGHVQLLPMPSVTRKVKARVRFLTDEEEGTLVRQLGDPMHAMFAQFLVDTGLRPSEALNLRWEDISPTAITVPAGKTSTIRVVPTTTRVRNILAVIKDDELEARGPWSSLSYAQFIRSWSKARSAMSLDQDPDFVPYVLRHTFASRLVQRGAPLQVVQKLLGHTNSDTTQIYAHLATENLKEAVAKLEPTP